MKIGGIAGKHQTLKKGEIIELSAEEKVRLQAFEELSKNSDTGYKFMPTKAVILGNVQVVKGRVLATKSEPSQYVATMLISYRPLRLADDRLFQEKTIKVKIHCEDSKDDLGMPDLRTVDYKVLS